MPLIDGVSVCGDIGDINRSIRLHVRGDTEESDTEESGTVTPPASGLRRTFIWVARETTMTYFTLAAVFFFFF